MGFAILQINSNVFVYQDMLEFTAFAYATHDVKGADSGVDPPHEFFLSIKTCSSSPRLRMPRTMSKGLTPASTRLTSFSSVIGRLPFESSGLSPAVRAAPMGITLCHIGGH
jgi:hypothetical protein